DRNVIYSLVPMSGGASGAVLFFRPVDLKSDPQSAFGMYIREAVVTPLRSLRESLPADAAAALEQILFSLELAPGIEMPAPTVRPVPGVSDLVRRVGERFIPYAEL